jgi:hypothetical protein
MLQVCADQPLPDGDQHPDVRAVDRAVNDPGRCDCEIVCPWRLSRSPRIRLVKGRRVWNGPVRGCADAYARAGDLRNRRRSRQRAVVRPVPSTTFYEGRRARASAFVVSMAGVGLLRRVLHRSLSGPVGVWQWSPRPGRGRPAVKPSPDADDRPEFLQFCKRLRPASVAAQVRLEPGGW